MKKRTQLLLWRQANRYFSGSATRFALNSGITTGEELIKLDKEYIIPLYEKNPVIFTHGQGVWLYSHDDKKYLDCFSGIAVSALGHAHPAIINAVQDQVTKLIHIGPSYHNEWTVPIAKRMVDSCNFASKIFFCNTGAEANEAALKFTRKAAKQIHPEKTNIVAFKGSFHGRTMGAVSMTYKEQYRVQYSPLLPTVQFGELNNVEELKSLINDKTATVIVEPIQGEGGVRPATEEFLGALRRVCDQNQAYLLFDEVQCGLGRSGHLWAHQKYNIEPDVLAFAKPIAGGIPMGGVLVSEQLSSVMKKGDHGTTFGGGPLACRAATVVFDEINTPEFLNHVSEMGTFVKNALRDLKHPKIVDVRGEGLLLGVELSVPVAPVLSFARERGVIFISAGDNTVRFCPPLIIQKPELELFINVFKDALATL